MTKITNSKLKKCRESARYLVSVLDIEYWNL